MSEGVLFSIEEFAVNDGPGIRTTVFMKGCPLRCMWCHNPEGQSPFPQPLTRQGKIHQCGYRIEASALAEKLRRDEEIFRDSGGGVTFTGGEPLMQADFLCDVMDALDGIHKVVETCAHASEEVFARVLDRADMILLDVKLVDTDKHRKYTGAGNELILRNLEALKQSGKDFVVRAPLIPGVNDTYENMVATADLISGSVGLKRVELLRYHKTAGAKYPMVGLTYNPDFDEDAQPKIHDVFTERGIELLIL